MLDFKKSFADMGLIEKFIVSAVGLLALLLLILAGYFAKVLFTGRSAENMPASISVSATGEVKAVPNIATFTFATVEEGKDVNEAQGKMVEKANKAIEFIKSKGIEDKDIETTNYSANPKYEYQYNTKFPGGTQVLVGYEARQNIKVKVRDQAKTGDILSGVGAFGVSELSGLSFESEDQDKLRDEATEDAINKAKAKAERWAEVGGFRLVKVISFYEENPGSYPMPYGYGGDAAMMEKSVASPDMARAPEIMPGENTIRSTVSITYEIR